jgi:hypothetical protein
MRESNRIMTNRPNPFAPRWRAGAIGLAAAVLLGGCDLLTVDNPGAITEPDLEDPARIPLIVNGVMGEFQRAYGWYTLYTASFSGETTDTHVFAENRDVQLREVSAFTGLLNTNYTRLQRTRAAGDIAAERIRALLGEQAESHLGMARSLAYSGYAMTLLAESYCEAPINVSSAFTPDQLFAMAIERFDDAIGVATRGRSGNPASADSILGLARLGAARAALNRGENAQASQYASQVPAEFEFWVAFSDNSTIEWNQFWNATRFGNAHLQPGPGYLEMDDPRVPRTPDLRILQTPAGFSSAERGYLPLPPMNYTGWGADTVIIQQNTDVRFASGLEARYIVAEADGPTAATLAFVNERRAVGDQDPVNLTGEALMAELRDQRRRDFYLTGHRLGDVRRYIRQGVGNYFPTGEWTFPPNEGTAPRVYGSGQCFPIPNSELQSNPNL